MTDGVDDFFDGSVRSGAPSIKLSDVNDGVIGEIVDQFKVEAKEFGSDNVKKDKKTGNPIMQLVVVLQTEYRNWDRVAKVPRVDASDRNSAPKDPSEDDGRRALYVEPWTNLHSAIGKATAVHNGGKATGLRNGATLGVKVASLEDVNKGNLKKVHEAVYTPPTASSGDFFGSGNTAGGPGDASQQGGQPAPSTPAPQQNGGQPATSAQADPQDPWGASTQKSDAPPF